MKRLAFIFLVLACVGFASSHDLNTLYAPGVGARAMGMGGAFVAMSGDPACLFWNPAGCAWAKKPSGYIEGAYEERWSGPFLYPSYTIPPYYGSGYEERATSFSSRRTSPMAIAALIPLPHVVVGLGLYLPYETRLKGEPYSFRGQNAEPRAIGRVQRTTLSLSTGRKVTGVPKVSLGLNVNFDRLQYERSEYFHSTYSWSYGWSRGNSETFHLDETRVDNQGVNFEVAALIETEEGLSFGMKLGSAADWEGEGSTYYYRYEYSHQVDSLRDTTTVREESRSAPLKNIVTTPQFVTLGVRLYQEVLSFGIELTLYNQDQPRAYPMEGYSIYPYYPKMFSKWGVPTVRAGLEVHPVKGLFLRGGAYGYSIYGSSGYNGLHEPAGFTGGLGYERKGMRADLAVERQSAGGREKSTRATLGLTYALGK